MTQPVVPRELSPFFGIRLNQTKLARTCSWALDLTNHSWERLLDLCGAAAERQDRPRCASLDEESASWLEDGAADC